MASTPSDAYMLVGIVPSWPVGEPGICFLISHTITVSKVGVGEIEPNGQVRTGIFVQAVAKGRSRDRGPPPVIPLSAECQL